MQISSFAQAFQPRWPGEIKEDKGKYQEVWSFSSGFQLDSSQSSPNVAEVRSASCYAEIEDQQPEPR